MAFGDILLKLSNGEALTSEEKSLLQLQGNGLQTMVTIPEVSQWLDDLGVMRAGKFLALSSGIQPTDSDATGAFVSAQGETFGSYVVNIGTVLLGVLQTGFNTVAQFIAGAGSVIIDALGIKIVDNLGNTRMIMSDANLLGEFGVNANFLAIDTYGKPTFWGDADDGSFTTAAGNLTSSYQGMVSNNIGVFLENRPYSTQRSFYGGLRIGLNVIYGSHFFTQPTSELAPANNSFEFGFTGWTTVGTPLQVEDSAGGGKYCAEVTNVDTVAWTFTTTVNGYYLLQFMLKSYPDTIPYGTMDIVTTGVVSAYQPGAINGMPHDRWVRVLVLLKATGLTINVKFKSFFATAVRFDDVSCFQVAHGRSGFYPDAFGDGPATYELYAETGIKLGTGLGGDFGPPSGVEFNTFIRLADNFQIPPPQPFPGYLTLYGKDRRLYMLNSDGIDFDVAGGRANYSVAAQTPAAATRTYITGSKITVPSGKLQIGTILRWHFNITKTAAGIAASTFGIAFGTAGTTADTTRVSFTKPAGTAVIDEGWIEIEAIVRGPLSASGIVAGHFNMTHNKQITGHAIIPVVDLQVQSTGFDVTVNGLFVGVCITSGAADAITIQQVTAEALNL